MATQIQRTQLKRHPISPDIFRAGPIVERRSCGFVAIPGLRDLHTHPGIWSLMEVMERVSLRGCQNAEEVVAELSKHNGRTLIVADGLNSASVPGLTRADLDRVSVEIPIFIFDPSYHSGYLNTNAWQAVSEATAPRRESFAGVLEDNGHWTENYLFACLGSIARNVGEEAFTNGMLRWIGQRMGEGVVEIHEMVIGDLFTLRCLVNAANIWKEKMPDGVPFPVTRVYALPAVVADLQNEPSLKDQVDSFFGGIGIKLFADGSLGSYTACLEHPYANRDTSGYPVDTPERLAGFIQMLHGVELRGMAIHAIGDRGILQSLEMARKLHDARGVACRLEHFEMSGDHAILDATRQLVNAKIIEGISMQTVFVSDVADYADRLGCRTGLINPLAKIVELGIPVNIGTDGMPQSMLRAVLDAVAHPVPEHRVTADLALRIAATPDGFYVAGQSLSPSSHIQLDPGVFDGIQAGTNIPLATLHAAVQSVFYHGYDVKAIVAALGTFRPGQSSG